MIDNLDTLMPEIIATGKHYYELVCTPESRALVEKIESSPWETREGLYIVRERMYIALGLWVTYGFLDLYSLWAEFRRMNDLPYINLDGVITVSVQKELAGWKVILLKEECMGELPF